MFDYVNVVAKDGQGGYFVPKDVVPAALEALGEGSYVEEPFSSTQAFSAWLRKSVEQRALEHLILEGDPAAPPPRGIINADGHLR